MKKVLKRIATMAVALALIVITGISMAACGSDSSSNNSNNSDNSSNTTNICNIDNLNGFYANIAEQKLYYFYENSNGGLSGFQGEFSLVSEEPDENGLYHLRVWESNWPRGGKYSAKLKVERHSSPEMVVIYHQWSETIETILISTYKNDDNKDLSKQFYAADEKIIYTKISGLDGFLAEVFPGKQIDTTDMTHVDKDWEDLILAL
ncbi:MAG: hypothetical protein NC133_04010 [Prevotella sp.]|nr:hypothetical protein [Prevotella sp.]